MPLKKEVHEPPKKTMDTENPKVPHEQAGGRQGFMASTWRSQNRRALVT